ncbi:hypothetical protein [Pseudoroseomonas cervicalis]|uniref:hypothetical protein n=1 Tax=Teichococcus cervicalis TaxID=204525 RepID=UPI0022F1D4EA|nr:hypothetical protein [Pseudoroseomonas cervicalis]WBV41576.1 hypothetical protein PFY06_09970 [Pseudoroseomonas cervicalis]
MLALMGQSSCAPRLHGLPERAPALPCGTSALPAAQRELATELTWDLPSLAQGAQRPARREIRGARQGDPVQAVPVSSTRFGKPDAAAWTNNTVRVMARTVSPGAPVDLVR